MTQSAPKIGLAEADAPPYMEFVGDMEAKYLAEIDPWEQSGQTGDRAEYYTFARERLLSSLSQHVEAEERGLEIGCGYGYLTNLLARQYDMVGLDVSETAIKRAQTLNPGIQYERYDVTAGYVLEPLGKFDFVILSQLWWYVLHELGTVMENCRQYLKPEGLLVLHQAFLHDQKYMKELADGFHGSLQLLMLYDGFRLIEAQYDDTDRRCYNDGLIIMRKVV